MDVSSKLLLNSAESIIRDRQQESRSAGQRASSASGSDSAGAGAGISQTSLEARMLRLQANLNDIQKDYSREQARQTYLRDTPGQVTADLRFGEETLFPELLKQPVDREGLEETVNQNMDRLMRSLKTVQVEMENLYALNFNDPPQPVKDASALLEKGLRNLDPARVARLTELS